MTSQQQISERGSPSQEVQHGFCLFLGALGQSLSQAASVRHAAWWSGAEPGDLNDLIQKLYPRGIEEERHAQILAFRSSAELRAEAHRLFDINVSRTGMGLGASLDRINWLVHHFPVRDAGFLMRVMNEREIYWKKKSLFHIFLAGRADPIMGYPDYLQAPLPHGMVIWRGL